jgi:hypothetical protein
MKRHPLPVVALLWAWVIAAGSSVAQTIEPGPATNEIQTPATQTIFESCVGESAAFDGFVHALVKVRQNHLTTLTNFQGLSGVGQTSGKLYHMQCTGVTNVLQSDGPITTANVFNSVNLCALAANTSVIMMHEHVTFTPDGTPGRGL